MKRSDNRMKSVTMADIANALGISNVTVSNALAGKKGVSASLRAEVLLKARELGYRTEDKEEEPKSAEDISVSSGDIGIIAPQRYMNSKSGFHWQLYQELITQLKSYDRYAILDVVSEEDETNLRLPRAIENRIVSGLIMLGRPGMKFLGEISKWSMPIVFLDFSMRDFDFASVAGDDYYDMYRLASLLISHGHSNICYVVENSEEFDKDRYFGYCRAVAEGELEPLPPCSLEQTTEGGLIHKHTAFLCENRALAHKLIKAMNDAGVAVPEMASVACFSEIKTDDGIDITCVCRDPSHMARLAVEALRSKLSGSGKGVGRISVGGKIIVGSTMRSLLI